MSDKGGSDLDIFKDLAKRGTSPGQAPAPGPKPNQTLLGLQAPSRVATTRGMNNVPPPPPVPSRPPPPPSRTGGPSAPPPPLPGSSTINSRPTPGGTNSAPPPPSAPLPQAPPAPSVDMDWDDEDEKTSIYDRGGTEDSARSLLAASAPPPPAAGSPARSLAPPPRMSVPAPPTRPTNRPPPPVGVPGLVPAPTPAPASAQKPYRDNRSSLYLAIVGALVVAGAALWLLWPRTGSLVVTVSGPGNKPLDAVEILLNGNKKCASSPCTIDGLKADTYYVRAHAAGYQAMADIAVVVAPNGKAVQNLTLVRALGTGVKVHGDGAGLKLYVDGREVGPLPQEIKDMEPGEHTLKVGGSERFEEFEKKITVEPETMQTIGPLKLRVLKGLATIIAGNGADGAKVILISGSDRRTLPKLPITLDIPTNQPHTLVATRRGYDQFKLPIRFEDGQVEHTFEVALAELGTSPPEKIVTTDRPTLAPATPRESRPVPEAPTLAAAPAAQATLNINSIPVSNILVDGRPIGQTPRIGFKVSAGSHTVTFLHGEDRKAVPVKVSAGENKTVAVRF